MFRLLRKWGILKNIYKSGKSKIFKVHCATVVSIKILKILALPSIYTTTSPLNNDVSPCNVYTWGN